jgi:hypothetical protein
MAPCWRKCGSPCVQNPSSGPWRRSQDMRPWRPASISSPSGNYFFFDRHLAPIFHYFFLYTVFVCKFMPKESQNDVLGDLHKMISLFVGSSFGMPPLLLPGLEPASHGTPTVSTRVRCLSLKPDMDREVCSHPDSRISAKLHS